MTAEVAALLRVMEEQGLYTPGQDAPDLAVEEMRRAVELAPDNRDFRKSLKEAENNLGD